MLVEYAIGCKGLRGTHFCCPYDLDDVVECQLRYDGSRSAITLYSYGSYGSLMCLK